MSRYPLSEQVQEDAREDCLAIADDVEDRLAYMERIEHAALIHHARAERHFWAIEKLLPLKDQPMIAQAQKELDHDLNLLLRETARCTADILDLKGLHAVLSMHGDPGIKEKYETEIRRQGMKRRARRLASAPLVKLA